MSLELNTLTISSLNPDVGEATEELAIEYAGDSLAIGFNSQYITEVSKVLEKSQLEIGLNDDASPITIRCQDDSDYLYVVMPMRLN